MATTADARVPAHLWIIGIVSLLWNAYGCYEYLMTETQNQAYLAKISAEQLAYWETLPGWLVAFWALGVWGGLIGSILLLMRNRYAVWAFGASFIGALIGIGYQVVVAPMPASLTPGLLAFMPYVIIAFAGFLLWYSWKQEKNGVLH